MLNCKIVESNTIYRKELKKEFRIKLVKHNDINLNIFFVFAIFDKKIHK